jgi:catechol 2,3-dioxygenase-like lactoylglutathione lyase family enzyme
MRPLGARRIVDSADGIGYGRDRPELWLMPRRPAATPARSDPGMARSQTARPGGRPPAHATTGHVAIAAAGRRAVDAAHRAGLAAGGRDGGAPAPGASGPPIRYSGYLVDPDGAWVELVTGTR